MMTSWKIRKWLQSKEEIKAEAGPFKRVEFFVEMHSKKYYFMHLSLTGTYYMEYQLKPYVWANSVILSNGMPNSCPIKRDDVLRNERLLNQFYNAFIKELNMKFDKVKDR
jgi:hypothetical protein